MVDKSAFENYQRFEKELKHKNRFFVDLKFVESVKEAIKLNTKILYEGTKLYRARIHKFEDKKDTAFPFNQMFGPGPEEAIRGRGNPDGISYVYLASDINICIKEVSPQFNDVLTIGEFSLKTNANLINFVDLFSTSPNNYINSLNHCIRLSFSKSQLSARPEIEYLPYQFICELIKNENFDGVLYYSTHDMSISSENYNIVLFDSSFVDLDDSKCKLIQITSANYEYKEVE